MASPREQRRSGDSLERDNNYLSNNSQDRVKEQPSPSPRQFQGSSRRSKKRRRRSRSLTSRSDQHRFDEPRRDQSGRSSHSNKNNNHSKNQSPERASPTSSSSSSESSEEHRRERRTRKERRHRRRFRSRSQRRSHNSSRSRSRSISRSRSRSRRRGRRRRSDHRRREERRSRRDDRYEFNEDTHHENDRRRRRADSLRRSYSVDRERPRRHSRRGRYRHERRRGRRSSSFSSSSSWSPRRRRRGRDRPREFAVSTRAGVVSDDDDGHLGGGTQMMHIRRHNMKAAHDRPAGERETAGWDDGRFFDDDRCPNQKRESAQSSSQNHDDTVGHFWGGPGTMLADRYRVIRELGVGTFGRVVECLDLTKTRSSVENHRQQNQEPHPSREDSMNLVAIKMVRKVKRYYDSALIEADIVSDVNRRGGHRGRGTSHFAIMYDAFNFHGHYCLVFESLGPSLYDILKQNNYQPFPMNYVRDFSLQLLEAIEFLHSFRLIHTDLKPENILVTKCREIPYGSQKLPESTRIKVIDFGGSVYDEEKKSSVVNTRQYRAPEVILGCGWSMPSDLWSCGCILAELYQGDLLFATHDNHEHLALIERIISPFPRRMLKRAKELNSPLVHAFDSKGRVDLRGLSADNALHVRESMPLESIVRKSKDSWFLKLLRRLIVIDPENRSSARDALRNCFG